LAPECPECGGLLKPATISFGQAMPQAVLQAAEDRARECDVFLAVGSSLVVYPAALLPVIAKRSGARLVIGNREPTPLDDTADCVVRGQIGEVMPALAAVNG
ncbi:MAG: NAD-dependent protein deacylase, partial [Pirellulales bacterium]|nr:NAD-dependent protein deacylase [Pirellulales bacterium]